MALGVPPLPAGADAAPPLVDPGPQPGRKMKVCLHHSHFFEVIVETAVRDLQRTHQMAAAAARQRDTCIVSHIENMSANRRLVVLSINKTCQRLTRTHGRSFFWDKAARLRMAEAVHPCLDVMILTQILLAAELLLGQSCTTPWRAPSGQIAGGSASLFGRDDIDTDPPCRRASSGTSCRTRAWRAPSGRPTRLTTGCWRPAPLTPRSSSR